MSEPPHSLANDVTLASIRGAQATANAPGVKLSAQEQAALQDVIWKFLTSLPTGGQG